MEILTSGTSVKSEDISAAFDVCVHHQQMVILGFPNKNALAFSVN